jgi:hypothetical protein
MSDENLAGRTPCQQPGALRARVVDDALEHIAPKCLVERGVVDIFDDAEQPRVGICLPVGQK